MEHPDNLPLREAKSSNNLVRFVPFLIIAITFLAYFNSFTGPMIFDDIPSIRDNPSIQQLWPLTVPLMGTPIGATRSRPTANLSLAFNYALGGFDVSGYHAVNLIVHMLTALLLYGVVRRTLSLQQFSGTFGRNATGIATAIALIWSVHPLTTSAVTYICQRTEALMGLFYLLTLYCVIRGATSPRSARWYVAAVAACGLGMGSKEVMVSAPLIVLLYDRIFLSQSFRRAWQERRSLYLGLAATWLVLAASFLTASYNVKRGGGDPFTVFEYLRTQSLVILHYWHLSFWPNALVLDYFDWPVAHLSLTLVASCLVIIAALATTAWALRFRPALGFLGAFFFIILAPTSSFMPLWGEVASERRMYLPLMAIVTLAVIACQKCVEIAASRWKLTPQQYRRVPIIAICLLVAALGTTTTRRNADYRSALAIWSDTAAKRPGNWRAVTEVGTALAAEGQFVDAITCFQRAVQLRPDYAMAYANWGVTLGMQGKLDDAITELKKSLQLDPRSAYAHYNLGLAFSKQGHTALAQAQFEEALRTDPAFTKARVHLQKVTT